MQPLVFFLIVTTLFPLGLSLQLSLLKDMAPGVLWTAALLSSLLSLESLFKSDADDGTLEQLALSGQSLTVIVIAKTAAHWLLERSGAGADISAGRRCARHSERRRFRTMLASLALGTLTLSWLGAIGAALTVGLKRGNVLLSLIVLPLAMPLLIFGAGATDRAISGTSPAGALYFLGIAMRVHRYSGALRGHGRAAHHARMTRNGTKAMWTWFYRLASPPFVYRTRGGAHAVVHDGRGASPSATARSGA